MGRRVRSLATALTAAALLAAPLLTVPTVHAAEVVSSVTPTQIAAVGGYQTLTTVTHPDLLAGSVLTIDNCTDAKGNPVAGSGSITGTTVDVSTKTMTAMLGPFAPSTCDVSVTTTDTPTTPGVKVGQITYTTTNAAYLTPVGIAPSILPNDGKAGDAAFMISGTVINPTAAVGDTTGFGGATGAVLTCGTVSVPATVTPTGATSAPYPQAIVTPAAATIKTVPAGTACNVTVTLASGNTVDTTAVAPQPGVWVDSNVPAITLSPTSGAAGQTAAQAQWVTASGTGLNTATGVQFAFCPASNPIATYPVATIKPAADGSSISFPVPNVPPADCAVIITLPTSGARPAGYSVASVPPAGGFTFLPPYQGPITLTVTNPYLNGAPISGIADADLYVSALAGGTGTMSGFAKLNSDTLVSVPFTKLAGYNADTHTGTITLTPPLMSGNLYFSNADITGAPPNPLITPVRYGFAEFTYDTAGLDVDFTMIDQIGVTMSQTLTDANGAVIPGSYRDTGCLVDLVNDLSNAGVNMNPTTAATNPGVMRYNGKAPTTVPAAGQWTSADLLGSNWVGLLGASKAPTPYPGVQTYTTSITGPLTLTDNVGDPKYGGQFTYTAKLTNGIWTLEGTIGGGAGGVGTQPGPTILVEAAGLYGPGTKGGTGYGVYAQDGPFKVTLPNGKSYTWSNGAALKGTGWTNVTKTIYRDFIAGFAYGYWGSSYGGGTNTGLNAVNFTMDPSTGAYNTAQPKFPVAGEYAWNVYDQIIRDNSNIDGAGSPKPSGVYAMPYSDTFVPSDLSPNQQQGFAYGWQVTLGDPTGCLPKPSLTPASQTVRVEVGTPIETGTFTTSGFTGPVTYSISPVLPYGLTMDTSTGVVTGAPTAVMTATTYTITGTSGKQSATATVSIAVGPDPAPPAAPKPVPEITCPPGSFLYEGMCVEPA